MDDNPIARARYAVENGMNQAACAIALIAIAESLEKIRGTDVVHRHRDSISDEPQHRWD